jgi:hypothetical protein
LQKKTKNFTKADLKSEDIIDFLRKESADNLPVGNKDKKIFWQAEDNVRNVKCEIEI